MVSAVLRRCWPLAAVLLSSCGGGGGDTSGGSTPPPPSGPNPSPSSTVVWLSGAAQTSLYGDADSGMPGPLFVVDPLQAATPGSLTPERPDSSVTRIVGGRVDATLSSLSDAGPRAVVFDAPSGAAGPFAFSLFKLGLDVATGATPSAQRLSSESQLCSAIGPRFTVIGQSLGGDEAVITYGVPDGAGSCAGGGRPRLVVLSMGATAAPVVLPESSTERLDPVGAIHSSGGAVAAFLAWRDGRFVRTDARLGSPVPIQGADIGGSLSAASAPTGPGVVTRFGIFILSSEGLRRYDKSTGRISDVLVAGPVGSGAVFSAFHDDQALYITATAPNGSLNLYRVTDSLQPSIQQLNVEGPLSPYGFRVLRNHVLYALDLPGSTDYVAWRKSDGQRRSVLAGKNILVATTLHDRVLHESVNGAGARVLATSIFDGSDERVLGDARLVSRSIAAQIPPFARNLRDNGAFGHVLVVQPLSGATGLGGAAVRWVSLDDTPAVDIEAGVLPSGLDLGSTIEAAGIVGASTLLAVNRTATTGHDYFAARKSAGSLVLINR